MRRYRAPFAAFGLLTSVLLCGCGNREAKIVGAWRVQVPQAASTVAPAPSPDASATSDPAQAMGRAMGAAFAKMGEGLAKFGQGMMEGIVSTFRLDLRSDRTFTLHMMVPIEGTWSLDGDTLTLTPTTVLGQPADSTEKNQGPTRLRVSPDGSQLIQPSDKPNEGELVWVKEKMPDR